MIIVIGGVKGGGGKSTIATNLAAIDVLKGHDVLLVDADKQATASAWAAARAETNSVQVPTVQKMGGLSLTNDLKALAKKYERVYVDSSGHDNESLRASLLVANLILIPVRPASFDVWTLPHIIEIVSQSQTYNPHLHVLFVANGIHPSPNVKQLDEVFALTEDVEGMVFAKSVLHNRLAFSKASGMGLSVVELSGKDRDPKATTEAQNLYEEITNG
jgi:chromosome partitioning protein